MRSAKYAFQTPNKQQSSRALSAFALLLKGGCSTKLPKRSIFWPVAVAVYWLCAIWLLFKASPIYEDGYGRIPSFYWGARAPASYAHLLYPYFVAASIITFLGCFLTTWFVGHLHRTHFGLFLISALIEFLSLLVAAIISDAGTALHIWIGPTMLGAFSGVLALLKVLIPMSVLAGAFAVTRNRLKA